MISIISEAPKNIAAFTATGEVIKEDFDNIVMPYVKAVVEKEGELNYLLNIETDLSNFSMGAWLQDALLGLQNLTKWNRAAIVTDKKGVQIFTEIFSKIMPGEFKAFDKDDLQTAIQWASTGVER